jgi:hypothetical protein
MSLRRRHLKKAFVSWAVIKQEKRLQFPEEQFRMTWMLLRWRYLPRGRDCAARIHLHKPMESFNISENTKSGFEDCLSSKTSVLF